MARAYYILLRQIARCESGMRTGCGFVFNSLSAAEWSVQGKPLHTLKDHAHWVTTLSLNSDFVLRTGPFDHTGKLPSSDEEGTSVICVSYDGSIHARFHSSSIPCFSTL